MMVCDLTLAGESCFSAESDSSLSDDAGRLKQMLRDALAELSPSESFGRPYHEVMEALNDVFWGCSKHNWDGYGAKAVDLLAYYHAARFLEALPPFGPFPDVGVDPDGEVSFGWYLSPRQVFSVSVGRDGMLSYAGLFGLSKVHGTEYLGKALPKAVTDNLARLFR